MRPADFGKILEERGKTHGSFQDNARFCQTMNRVFKAFPEHADLSDVQKEALSMCMMKIGRIVSGSTNHLDDWVDAAGFLILAVRDMETEEELSE